MNDSDKLWRVAQTVYFFMTGEYNTTDTTCGLPVIDSPYTYLIPNNLTDKDGAVFKEFNTLYGAKEHIIEELNRLENKNKCEYEEIESLLSMSERLMEMASIEAFISGYRAVHGINGEKDLKLRYEELLKKQFTHPNCTEVYSYDYLSDCFAAVQERLYLGGTERKASPDLHLMKLSYNEMLCFSTGKAYSYGLLAGSGELPMWYEDD